MYLKKYLPKGPKRQLKYEQIVSYIPDTCVTMRTGGFRQGCIATNPIELGMHVLCSITPTPESFAHLLWIFYNPKYSKYDTQEAAAFYNWIYQTPDIDPHEEDSWVTPEDIQRFHQI